MASRYVFALAAAALLSSCAQLPSSASADGSSALLSPGRSLPTAADPFHLHLNDPTGRPAPSEACDVALCTSLLDLINASQTSIDFAIYGIRGQPEILKAIEDAKARGVRIRGVVDRTTDGENYYSDTETLVKMVGMVRDDLLTDQRTASTKKPYDPASSLCWMDAPEGFIGPKQCVGYDLGDRCILAVHASREALNFEGEIMHNKYFVVDGTYVWMGSTNVSDSGTGGYNANVVGVWHSPELAMMYTQEFEQMFTGQRYHQEKNSVGAQRLTFHDDLSVQLLFTPQDRPIDTAVRPLLQNATKRIDVGIFFLTHKGIAADLIEAHRRGVKVRVILDATAAKNGYTKHELLRAAGIPVKIENWGGKMHMKSVAVDGKTIVIGSMNWTSAGNRTNDENTLVVQSKAAASKYHRFYDQLWDQIPDRWLKGRPDPESKDSTTACTDGSDNDFDHLDDAEDPGCGASAPPLPELPGYTIVPKAPNQGLLKGNISSSGRRIYHVPGGLYYDDVEVTVLNGEAYYCSAEDAKADGFKRSSR